MSRVPSREGLLSPRTILPTAAIAAAGFMISNAIRGCGSEPVHITPGATIESIKVSDAIPLIDNFAKASASANETTKFMGVEIPMSDREVETTINGIVELRTQQDGVEFSTYKLPSANNSKEEQASKYGVVAHVNTDRIYMRPSFSTLFRNGKPQVNEHHELLGASTAEGVLKRQALADAGARIHFVASCGREILPTIRGGMEDYTRKTLEKVASLPSKLPGGEKEASMIREMAHQEIKVVFSQDPSLVKLRYQNTSLTGSPIQPLPNEKIAMDNLLKGSDGKKRKEYENVTLNPGEPCHLTGKSAGQLYKLSGGTDTNPGV